MDIVLYFQSSGKTSTPEKLEGVRDIAEKVDWQLRIIEEFPTRQLLARLVDFWHPIGCIVECGWHEGTIDTTMFKNLPTVFFDFNPKTLPESVFSVSLDSHAAARMAARELMLTGYESFAFVHPHNPRFWSHDRDWAFSEALKMNGKTCQSFIPKGPITDTDAPMGSVPITYQRQLRAFLKTLALPCAIFAANDPTALEVLIALSALGIKSKDFSVIGVDNYAEICDHSQPKLTSIDPDFRGGGTTSALLLLARLRYQGRFVGKRNRWYGPKCIVHRDSTKLPPGHDAEIAAALELIEARSCQGLTAAEVVARFKCSRDMAEIRFRKATGKSILEKIHEKRLQRAKELLRNPFIQLKTIADFCGFEHSNSLRKFFLKQTGMTMSTWRSKFNT